VILSEWKRRNTKILNIRCRFAARNLVETSLPSSSRTGQTQDYRCRTSLHSQSLITVIKLHIDLDDLDSTGSWCTGPSTSAAHTDQPHGRRSTSSWQRHQMTLQRKARTVCLMLASPQHSRKFLQQLRCNCATKLMCYVTWWANSRLRAHPVWRQCRCHALVKPSL